MIPPADAAAISLVLIDDNRLLREGIAALIERQPGFRVLVASADVNEAIEKVRLEKPDIVLVNFGLVEYDSAQITSRVREEVPTAKVIVMGFLPTQEDVADYVHAGAAGFIMKDASSEVFFATIRTVALGMQVLPPALTSSLFAQIVRNEIVRDRARVQHDVRLTSRERDVVDLLSEGLSNKEISARLGIAIHTVKSHVHNVLEKLALHSRLEVVAFTHSTG
ncbi:MAG: response regulator transcription factor [Gemmatimonadaceae bacterium]|nr:response regulator transcription factor [Gemmatimonadaceae bacterium]